MRTSNLIFCILLTSFVLLLFLTPLSAAEGLSINVAVPSRIFPGDTVSGRVILYNPNWKSVNVQYVELQAPSNVYIKQKFYFNIGWLPQNSSCTIPFTVRVLEPGYYILKCKVWVDNFTATKYFGIKAVKEMPQILILSRACANKPSMLKFAIETPVPIYRVSIKPLFNATPPEIFFSRIDSSAKFTLECPVKGKKLYFKIVFYDNGNTHVLTQSVSVLQESLNPVTVKACSPVKVVHVGDVIPIQVKLFNTGCTVKRVMVNMKANGTFLEKSAYLPYLNRTATLVFNYSPPPSPRDRIMTTVEYSDSLGNRYTVTGNLTLNVSLNPVLSLSNVELKDGKLKGDVGNCGVSSVFGVVVSASSDGIKKSYFIGEIKPQDLQEFEIKLPFSRDVNVTVKWTNTLGEKFYITRELKVEKGTLQISDEAIVAVAIFIAFPVAFKIKKYKTKR